MLHCFTVVVAIRRFNCLTTHLDILSTDVHSTKLRHGSNDCFRSHTRTKHSAYQCLHASFALIKSKPALVLCKVWENASDLKSWLSCLAKSSCRKRGRYPLALSVICFASPMLRKTKSVSVQKYPQKPSVSTVVTSCDSITSDKTSRACFNPSSKRDKQSANFRSPVAKCFASLTSYRCLRSLRYRSIYK